MAQVKPIRKEVDGVRWEEPPDSGSHGNNRWAVILAPLMLQSGRWARVAERPTIISARSIQSNLRQGACRIPAGRWEFVARKVDGGGAVYARYLGPAEAVKPV